MKPRERTHWTDCWRDHHECAVAEVERLRADLARITLAATNIMDYGAAMDYPELFKTLRDAGLIE